VTFRGSRVLAPADDPPDDRWMPASPLGGSFGVARVVWLTMVASVGVYFVLLAVLVGAGGAVAQPELVMVLRRVFLIVAGLESFAIWVIHRRLLGPAVMRVPGTTESPLEPGRALGVHLVCWALGESIAIYGLVLGLLGHELGAAAPFFVWGAALLVFLRPRAEVFA